MPIRFAVTLTVFVIITVLSGCQKDNQQSNTLTTFDGRDFAAEKSSWLRDHLPKETLAYVSVPNIWNYLFDPKGDSLHEIQENPAFQIQIQKIKQAVENNYMDLIPVKNQTIVKTLLHNQSGPLEIAAISYIAGGPIPNVAIGTHFKNFSDDQLSKLLNQLMSTLAPGVSPEITSEGDKQWWHFEIQNMPNWIQYQAKTGQFLLLSGPGASKEKITRLWTKAADPALSEILELDNNKDPSGLNLRLWMAPAKLYQLGAGFLAAEHRQQLQPLAIDKTEFVWLGTGSNQRKSSLAIHYLMPETGWRMFIPRTSSNYDITTAGKPDSVIQFALPSNQQWQAAINQPNLPNNIKNSLQEIGAKFKTILGFEANQLLDAYEQSYYVVNDEAGRWMAMKIKDAELHEQLSQQLMKFMDNQPQQDSLAGVNIHHMHFSSLEKLYLSGNNEDKNQAKIAQFLGLMKNHQYWLQKDGVIYMAKVPQILADLSNHEQPVQLSDWLAGQGLDWHNTILAYGTEIDGLPRDVYHYYLTLVQSLADLAGTEMDLFALPTARELNLPEKGRLSLSMHSDDKGFSIDIDYEYSLAEHILGSESGVATIGALAILIAYAVPAYRDYTLRAKINETLAETAAIKLVVAEHYIATGQFSGAAENMYNLPANMTLDDATGTIILSLEGIDSQFNTGDIVQLVPEINGSIITWQCTSNIKTAWLPGRCR